MSQYPPVVPGALGLRPHRGTPVLVLGILSLVIPCGGWIFGIIAWAMGNGDMREMRAGRMDPAGLGTTQAGKICGMISVLLHAIGIVVWLLWVFVFVGAVAAGAAGGGHP